MRAALKVNIYVLDTADANSVYLKQEVSISLIQQQTTASKNVFDHQVTLNPPRLDCCKFC